MTVIKEHIECDECGKKCGMITYYAKHGEEQFCSSVCLKEFYGDKLEIRSDKTKEILDNILR